MSTYAIGDIQGCRHALDALLEKIAFDPAADRLWLVGDLVNRGPDSLGVLRWARNLGDRAITVLGNHDLHLLAVAYGRARPHKNDTLDELLAAPDADGLLNWLRQQRMAYREDNWLMVHAGLLPQWSPERALALGQEVEMMLQGHGFRTFFEDMYGNLPDFWHDGLTGHDRLRCIVNAMTRMRFCTAEGVMDLKTKGEAGGAPKGYLPWFDVPGRRSGDVRIVCGHWSALGLKIRTDLCALDSGCLWGGSLSAFRLDDGQVFQVPCRELPGTRVPDR
jgi:bis(5'-nucleosyl)-tetraphosphatase (symmetrical)